jgi:hypothetical protein
MRRMEMGLFIAVAALIVGAANMGFNQAKANPEADSFFKSSSRHVEQVD